MFCIYDKMKLNVATVIEVSFGKFVNNFIEIEMHQERVVGLSHYGGIGVMLVDDCRIRSEITL